MILGIVFIGMIAGLLAFAGAVLLSAPLWVAGLAYVLGGMAGTLLAGLLLALRRAEPRAAGRPREAAQTDRPSTGTPSPKARRAQKA